MGVERTESIGQIAVAVSAFTRYYIDSAPKSVGTKSNRHHTLVDFDTFDKFSGNIINAKRGIRFVHRYPINKDTHVTTGKAIEVDIRLCPYPTSFAHFHSRYTGKHIGSIAVEIAELLGFDSNDVVSCFLHLLDR